MERNEASSLTAFGGFDMGLGMGINFTTTRGVHETVKTNTTATATASAVVGNNVVDRDLVAAARFDFLKKKRMPRFRRGTSGAAVRPFTSFTTPLPTTVSFFLFILIFLFIYLDLIM